MPIAHDLEQVEREITDRLAKLSRAQKVRLLSGQDHWSTYPEPAIGLRSVIVSDGTVGIRGVRWSEAETSINTPSATAIAAAFDPAVAREMGQVIGAEARRKGVDVVLGPVVNLHRTAYCGRCFEAFSEDPQLSAQLGAAMVTGMQDEGRATTVKHFVANEAETDRLISNSVIDERTLREAYLIPFEAVVAAGGLGVMSAYNRVNGILASESPLLHDVLKDEWHFDGLVISDWGAIRSVDESAGAGTDLAMPGPGTRWATGLLDALQAGRVSEAAVDDKLRRLLRLAARVGALDGIAPLVDPDTLAVPPTAETPSVRARLRRAAALGTVLLRNQDGLLPLDVTSLSTLAVIGPGAATPRSNGGGSAAVIAPHPVTPVQAIRDALPGTDVRYAEGARPATLVRTLTAQHGRAPDGSGVTLIEFLDAAGTVLGCERRDRLDTLIYGMGYPPGIPEQDVAAIRASTRLTVDTDGTYLFSGAGVGHAVITVNGTVRVDRDLIPMTTDAVIGMSLPPQAIIELDMTADRPVDVVFEYTPAPRTVAALRLGFDAAAPNDDDLIAEAVDAARDADAAVVIVGTGPEDEAEGFDRTTLALRGRQDDLVRAVAAVNDRTVVVVNAGAPVLLPWRDEVAAIVLPWFGGQEMSTALVDLLLGAAEPGGRLPVTFPADEDDLASPFPVDGDVVYREGLDIGYRNYARTGRRPAYPFGHGLGYTSWELGKPTATTTPAGVEISLRVENTGHRPGRTVVQAYCARPDSAVDRPVLWFAAAAPVDAAPGVPVAVTLQLPRRMFEHWDVESHRWLIEPGTFQIRVGTSSADLPHTVTVALPVSVLG